MKRAVTLEILMQAASLLLAMGSMATLNGRATAQGRTHVAHIFDSPPTYYFAFRTGAGARLAGYMMLYAPNCLRVSTFSDDAQSSRRKDMDDYMEHVDCLVGAMTEDGGRRGGRRAWIIGSKRDVAVMASAVIADD